ncbi:uncharacterized protein B0H64DRAFT_84938 [Chaetomium fimeti]|uniref:Secreted protein n=1 Tax=Chaetomium fimeti TaxID=1854472 RepID=A0AAE0HLS3_9PEZI|nr:hypothetical protein B0H64DRAFT_84938 [Chaetomium fimeti]
MPSPTPWSVPSLSRALLLCCPLTCMFLAGHSHSKSPPANGALALTRPLRHHHGTVGMFCPASSQTYKLSTSGSSPRTLRLRCI